MLTIGPCRQVPNWIDRWRAVRRSRGAGEVRTSQTHGLRYLEEQRETSAGTESLERTFRGRLKTADEPRKLRGTHPPSASSEWHSIIRDPFDPATPVVLTAGRLVWTSLSSPRQWPGTVPACDL